MNALGCRPMWHAGRRAMVRLSHKVRYLSLVLVAGAALGSAVIARAANPDALWEIVHDKCAVAVAPCLLIDEKEHLAFLKDRNGIAQILAIPTDKVTGVEDPAVLKPETPNFFADAWDRRSLMLARLPKPISRDSISLVVNAQTARTQNQLHVHIDCLSAEAREGLRAAAPTLTEQWGSLGVKIEGHDFLARKVKGATLDGFYPFREVAATLKNPAAEMYRQNVLVVGADFADGPGFIALTDTAPAIPLGYGSGEDVQDHDCKIAK